MGALATKMAKRRKAWWKGLRRAGSHHEAIEKRHKDFERLVYPEVGPFCAGTDKREAGLKPASTVR